MTRLCTEETFLVTGAAGVIGFYLSKYLLDQGCKVIGIDNSNNYYDPKPKEFRLNILKEYTAFTFKKMDIKNKENID